MHPKSLKGDAHPSQLELAACLVKGTHRRHGVRRRAAEVRRRAAQQVGQARREDACRRVILVVSRKVLEVVADAAWGDLYLTAALAVGWALKWAAGRERVEQVAAVTRGLLEHRRAVEVLPHRGHA